MASTKRNSAAAAGRTPRPFGYLLVKLADTVSRLRWIVLTVGHDARMQAVVSRVFSKVAPTLP